MTPQMAALVWLLFVAHLFWEDWKLESGASRALWLPLIWMFLAGSRYASAWLNLGQPITLSDDPSEGSPVDRAAFVALIVAGAAILLRRVPAWGPLLLNNKLLVAYFAYCFLSVFWSDDPFIAFKRWFKDLGNPVMALIILTDPKPLRAFGLVVRRLSYLLLPLSVLFIRYYPDLGRGYHADGSPMYSGAGNQKNALGMMCLVTGIYFAWQILQQRDAFLDWSRSWRIRLYVLVAMMIWLLHVSDSQTSLSCIVIVTVVFALGRISFVRSRPSRIMGLLLGFGLILVALESAFDIRGQVLAILGRNPSLTGRTEIWRLVLSMAGDPLIGTGFMSFWEGARADQIRSILQAGIKQAHNGYIEQYLNLGYIGVFLMMLLMLNGLYQTWGRLNKDTPIAMLQLSLILVAVVYNYTEASFYGISNVWLLTLIGLINVPNPAPGPTTNLAQSRPARGPDDMRHRAAP